MKAVLYARVSTDDPRQAGSCAMQLERCRQYCAAVGYEVVAEVVDDGVSGRTMERPGWRRVEALLASGGAHLVLATALDRFARTQRFHGFVELCERQGYSFAALDQKIDLSSAAGRMQLGIMLTVAEFYAAQTAEKIRGVRAAKAAQGLWTSFPPFGTMPGPERGVPVEDPERWPALLRIFELAADGRPDREILAWLKQSGVRSPRGAVLGGTTLRRVLESRFYLGEIVHGAHSFPARHQCRVPTELWQAAQRARPDRRGPETRSYIYLLDGLAVCSHWRITSPAQLAGQPVPLRHRPVRNRPKGHAAQRVYPMYCRGDKLKTYGGIEIEAADEGAARCKIWHNAQVVDAAVVEWLIAETESGALRERLTLELGASGEQARRLREQHGAALRRVGQLRGELGRLEGRAVGLVESGHFEVLGAVNAKLSALRADLAAAEQAAGDLACATARLDACESDARAILDLAGMLSWAWSSGHRQHLQRILKGLIRRADIRCDGIHLDLYTLPPSSRASMPVSNIGSPNGDRTRAFTLKE